MTQQCISSYAINWNRPCFRQDDSTWTYTTDNRIHLWSYSCALAMYLILLRYLKCLGWHLWILPIAPGNQTYGLMLSFSHYALFLPMQAKRKKKWKTIVDFALEFHWIDWMLAWTAIVTRTWIRGTFTSANPESTFVENYTFNWKIYRLSLIKTLFVGIRSWFF